MTRPELGPDSSPRVTAVGYQRLVAMSPTVLLHFSVAGSNFQPWTDVGFPGPSPPPPPASSLPSDRNVLPQHTTFDARPVIAPERREIRGVVSSDGSQTAVSVPSARNTTL